MDEMRKSVPTRTISMSIRPSDVRHSVESPALVLTLKRPEPLRRERVVVCHDMLVITSR